jgi:hypothetical protein
LQRNDRIGGVYVPDPVGGGASQTMTEDSRNRAAFHRAAFLAWAKRRATIDSFLRSFAFSALLSLSCAILTIPHAWALFQGFDAFELLHLAYNLTVAFLFLIRTRPSVVSMNLTHWVVALVTAFSGFLFARTAPPRYSLLSFTGDTLIAAAILSSLAAALTLGRSFDVFPALRAGKDPVRLPDRPTPRLSVDACPAVGLPDEEPVTLQRRSFHPCGDPL